MSIFSERLSARSDIGVRALCIQKDGIRVIPRDWVRPYRALPYLLASWNSDAKKRQVEMNGKIDNHFSVKYRRRSFWFAFPILGAFLDYSIVRLRINTISHKYIQSSPVFHSNNYVNNTGSTDIQKYIHIRLLCQQGLFITDDYDKLRTHFYTSVRRRRERTKSQT